MAYSLESVKGGISVNWKLENFLSIMENLSSISFNLDWDKQSDSWLLEIGLRFAVNKKSLHIYIESMDHDFQTTLSLKGTVCVVDGNCSFKLRRDKIERLITRAIDFDKEVFLKNGSLTLLIKLWDSEINDQIAVEYFYRSLKTQRIKTFHRILHGETDWKRYWTCTECSIGTIIKHTNINTNTIFKIDLSLQIMFNKLYAIWKIISENNFSIDVICKIKIQKKNETNFRFLDTEWFHLYESGCDNYRRMITDRKLDFLNTEWIVTVKLVLDDFNTIIEKMRYEPDAKTPSKIEEIETQTLQKRNSFSNRNESSKNKLQLFMHDLYKYGKFCDVIIVADNKSFPCHKAVLSCSSTVFQTMFENDEKEKETGIVNINDVESQILEKFLNYLYLDKIEDKEFDSALKLYAIADKYAVQNLKDDCVYTILSHVSTENVCELLELADKHQDEYLMQGTISYFERHIKEILNSPSWKTLLVNKPSLAANTFQSTLN